MKFALEPPSLTFMPSSPQNPYGLFHEFPQPIVVGFEVIGDAAGARPFPHECVRGPLLDEDAVHIPLADLVASLSVPVLFGFDVHVHWAGLRRREPLR